MLMFSLLLSVRASPATASAVANSSETTARREELAALEAQEVCKVTEPGAEAEENQPPSMEQ